MTWVDSATDYTFNGNEAVCNGTATQSTKFNAMWKEGDGHSKGIAYYEFEVVEGTGVFVGFTDETHFGAGWACKGMFYGGNTSSGGALVTQAFGPQPKAGDKIGALLEFKDDDKKIEVTFYHNGECLGQAFEVTKPHHKPLFPVLQCSHGGEKVKITKADPPSDRSRKGSPPNENFTGYWRCEDLSADCDTTQSGETIKCSFKIINKLSFAIADKGGDKWRQSEPVASTMMAGDPDLMEKESKLDTFLQKLDNVKLDGKDMIWTAGGETLKFTEQQRPIPQVATCDYLP